MVNIHTAMTYVSKALCVSGLALGLSLSAHAQSPSQAEVEFSSILQQISNIELSIAYKEANIASQKAQIESLTKQLAEVGDVTAAVNPMIAKMAASISNEIEKDIPFNTRERYDRLGSLQETLGEEGATPLEKMRKALTIFEAEVNYGQTFSSYEGDHPVAEKQGTRRAICMEKPLSGACALPKDLLDRIEDDGATVEDLSGAINALQDGNYLRFGRLALIYAQADGSDVHQYNAANGAWEEVSGGRALDLVQYVKMARGEAAVNVVTAPVYMSE